MPWRLKELSLDEDSQRQAPMRHEAEESAPVNRSELGKPGTAGFLRRTDGR